MKAVPFHFHKNIRTLSFKIGIPRSTIQRAMKLGLLKSSKNSIKPILTPKNKLDRVNYCHSFVQDNSFVDMVDRVDIDEKWFYLSQKVTSFILVPGDVPPLACVSTRITSRRQCVLLPWLAHIRILSLESGGTGRSVLGSSSDRKQRNECRRIERQGLWRLSLFP